LGGSEPSSSGRCGLGFCFGRRLRLPRLGLRARLGGIGLHVRRGRRIAYRSERRGLAFRQLAQRALVLEQSFHDVRVRRPGSLFLTGIGARSLVPAGSLGHRSISGAAGSAALAPAQQARSHDGAGIRKTRRTLPSVDFGREGGQSLFRIFGDGNHQSRHVREHAEQVRAYLEANLTQDLDMNAVARAASLSPFYLTRIFKQRYGVPPYRYLIGLRIDYASDLLRESSLSVTQVCHRSGFNSLSHFITTFRRHTGMSPSQFRRVVDWEQDARRFGQETEPLVERPRRMNF
jgi:AraC-like DNA-binding protein